MRNPLRRKALSASPAVVEAARDGSLNLYTRLGGVNQQVNAAWLQVQSANYAWMYRSQPAVRSVIDYIARNVAQLGLKLYERVDDNERLRHTDHPAAQTMAHPNEFTPADRFIFNFVADFLVNENAYALKFRGLPSGQRILLQIPAQFVGILSSARYTIEAYRVYRSDGTYVDVAPGDMIHWRGYNPEDPRLGVSRLETLRQTIAEDVASQTASIELAKSGLLAPGYIKRPLEAPDWSDEARQRFESSWANRAKGSTRKTPVLEEGMEFVPGQISPKDAQLLDGRRFTVEEVARVYGIPSGVVGASGASNRSINEERKQVYADVLPPITEQFGTLLDFSILEAEYGETSFYFEFDLNEKLRGDPEVRFPAMTSAAGRPWMTVNEIRAVENLPSIDGGDELTIPMNVALAGDQGQISAPQLPAANVMPPQDPNGPPQDGSHRKALEVSTTPKRIADMARQRRYIDEAKGLLDRFYARQGQAIKSAKGAKAADTERWNEELAGDLHKLIASIVEREGGIYAARLGGTDFDMGQVAHYIEAQARGMAENLNRATQRDIADSSASDAIARARNERAAVAAASLGTRATVFARQEAAKQAPGTEHRMQTWVADTDRHADLDGVSVPLGSDWGGIEPGSEPNCSCTASIA